MDSKAGPFGVNKKQFRDKKQTDKKIQLTDGELLHMWENDISDHQFLPDQAGQVQALMNPKMEILALPCVQLQIIMCLLV
ncbi:hypothetical protein QE152_g29890 [Popillia japonica]|uniref:Uncharacterized protein n=1 Tax=Popillia japonica TaxID=7064 RepID=A0AAW1JGL4_POPJA